MTQWKDRQIGGHTRPISMASKGQYGCHPLQIEDASFAVKGTNQAAHDELNRITLDKMQAIASDNYHPTVRLNSMLLIGDLARTRRCFQPTVEKRHYRAAQSGRGQ